MAGSDTMKITVLLDGTIKTVTDPISKANHSSAEAFLLDVARLAGGSTKREKRTDVHRHPHTHETEEHHHH